MTIPLNTIGSLLMTTYPPDSLTPAALFPLLLCHYAQAVLTILPNTFLLKLSLLTLILWQTWRCAIGFDCALLVARFLGRESAGGLICYNIFFASAMFSIASRSIEWTFMKRPVRYKLPKGDQGTLVERPTSVTGVLLDALDLLGNVRGIGWSWSPNPFPRESTPPPSIALLFFKMLVKLTAFDASHYILQLLHPSAANDPRGGSIFDPSLPLLAPRAVLSAAISGLCSGVWAYAMLDATYHASALVGRGVFRQPAALWPRSFDRPWMSTSVEEFWSVRWHQWGRRTFIVFGARPGGRLFGKPGAIMGAFAVSAVLHYVIMLGLGNGVDSIMVGAFFLLMGAGAVMEGAFTRVTGWRVRGWLGWSWTMLWTLLWATLMEDVCARHGILASEFFPIGRRPGKLVVDAVIARASAGVL